MGCQVFIQLFVQTLGTADLHVPRSNRHLGRRSVQTMHRVQYLAGSIGACLMTRTLHPSAPVHPVTSTINGPVRAAMEFLMRSPTFHMHPIMHPTSNVRNPAERPTSHMHPTSNVRYPAERPTAAVADAPATNPALSSGAKAISVTVTHRVTPPPATEPAPATAPS